MDFDFGTALNRLRAGRRVARRGWNGEGMWLVLVPGSSIRIEAGRPLGQAAPELVGQHADYRPHIDIKAADDTLVPWVASQTDLLAHDWYDVGLEEDLERERIREARLRLGRCTIRPFPVNLRTSQSAEQPLRKSVGPLPTPAAGGNGEFLAIAGLVRVSWHGTVPDDPTPAHFAHIEVCDADTGEPMPAVTAINILSSNSEQEGRIIAEVTEALDTDGKPYRPSSGRAVTETLATHTYLVVPSNRPARPEEAPQSPEPEPADDLEFAKARYELFRAYVAGGFTERQAIELLAAMCRSVAREE